MPTDTELPARGAAQARDPRTPVDADAPARTGERDGAGRGGDVDLAGTWQRVMRLWWLVLLVAIVVAGLSLRGSTSAPQRYESNATVYLGQPVTPSGALLNTVTAKATTAIEIATGDESVRTAAAAAGTTNAKVRAGLSVVSVASPIASKLQAPPTLIRVTVRLAKPTQSKAAADAISGYLVDQTNGYVDARQKGLKSRVHRYQQAIDELDAQRTVAVQGAARASGDTAGATFALLLATVSTDLRLAQADLDDAQAQLATSDELERSYVVTRPSAHKVTVASGRSSIAVALFLGLAVGIGVALLASLLGLGRMRPTSTGTDPA